MSWASRSEARPALLDGTVPEWTGDALCAEIDPDLWFRGHGANNNQAKKLCRECPVRAQCLIFGLDERWGVWGGLGPRARREMGFARGRKGIDYDIPEWDQ